MPKQTGWKPIPLSLKILFVVFVLWVIGSLAGLPARYGSGLPLLGVFVFGSIASIVVLLLDVIAPLAFLYALWTRRSWGPKLAFAYISFFILNSVVALFTVADQLGMPAIAIPLVVNVIFLIVIHRRRDYFKH